jgi:hypothetical protein
MFVVWLDRTGACMHATLGMDPCHSNNENISCDVTHVKIQHICLAFKAIASRVKLTVQLWYIKGYFSNKSVTIFGRRLSRSIARAKAHFLLGRSWLFLVFSEEARAAACGPHPAPAQMAGHGGKPFFFPLLCLLLVCRRRLALQPFHPAASAQRNRKGPMVAGQGGGGDRVGEAGEALCASILESNGSSSFSFACPCLRSCAPA